MFKIWKIIMPIGLFLVNNFAFAQTNTANNPFDKTVVQLKVKPSDTDPTIKTADSPHFIAYEPSIKQGKILLFMPGTGGIAEKGPNDFFATALKQGYRVINLSYINEEAVSQICNVNRLGEDVECAEKFRMKRVFGEKTDTAIPDQPQDAIVNRFIKLLLYLSEHDKEGNWGVYLNNGTPNWREVAVSGQSQGGGMAAFIAKRLLVARVIAFSGGWDFSAKGKIATWYSKNSVTPANYWYGTYNVQEPTATIILETYKAMAIPKDHIYALNLEVRAGKKAHVEGVKNTAYLADWIKLLGKGN